MNLNNENNVMTVADLISILSTVDPSLPVVMSMNGEYEGYVSSTDVFVYTNRDGVTELRIDDMGDVEE